MSYSHIKPAKPLYFMSADELREIGYIRCCGECGGGYMEEIDGGNAEEWVPHSKGCPKDTPTT